ncbi:unnamed protein product [Rotaria sordida]|uniref:C2H2-type domain-containing protein n=1 Tax=Rotaria sordida TaxID=392033 RepID=A0A819DN36_9BILA|nr:unnamed protein product [Rotaria sordida]
MAHLLGSKVCIDSLRVDINDLQNVIYDIIGKTGSLKCHSWKYPDKLATDVDMNELLERYQYGKNDLDNQVSHVILFEIIIDRLLLVVHGSWHFLHEIQTKLLSSTIDSSSTINQQTSLSVGLVVKKYWNKLLHLFTILQQHETNHKRSHHTTSSIRSKSNLNIEKYCQTIESSLGPCSSCIQFQQYLHNYSESIISLCHLYNLPSSLAHYRCSTSTISESLYDINQWFDCQTKDFDRLSKHVEYLHNTLNKTKNDLDLSENSCKQLNETNHNLEQIICNEKESKKKLEEFHRNKLIEIKKYNDQYQLSLNEQIKLLTTEKINIKQQLKEITEEYTLRGEQIKQLESSKNELKILMEDRIKSDDLIKTLEQDRIRLQTELDVVKRDVEERNRDLQKERIRIENMIRHDENYQSKQKTLTKSHEQLSKECELLKKKIIELEIERDELQKSFQIIQQQNQTSSDNIQVQSFIETHNHVLQEVTSLKSNIEQLQQQIQQMTEREKSLLQHSNSNGSIQNTSTTNNFVHDMQNEMRTNELRIDLLQKQNDSLKFSLGKLQHTNNHTNSSLVIDEQLKNQLRQQQQHTNETLPTKPKQTPLWLLNNEILEQQQQQQAFTETKSTTKNYIPHFSENDNAAKRWIKSDQDINIEILSQPQDHLRTTSSTHIHSTDAIIQTKSRLPIVNHSRTSIIPSRSDHEMIIAKGRLIISNRPSTTIEHTRRDSSLTKNSRTISSAKTQRLSTNKMIYRCTNCNKSFDDKRNYDIHKLYCRT